MGTDPAGITVSDDGPIRTLTIDRPERRNALTREILAAFPDLVGGGAQALIVTGAGDWFSAGMDVAELAGTSDDEDIDDLLAACWAALDETGVIAIGAIEGPCIGAALDLALGLDLLVAGDSAFFWLPAVRYGLVYRTDAVRALVAAAGPQVASLMLTVGARVSASAGPVAEVVPAGGALARAMELAREAIDSPAGARETTKRMLRALRKPDFDPARWDAAVTASSRSPERAEAVAAARRRHRT